MPAYITPEFQALIGPSRLDSFNSSPGTVYGLDAHCNLTYFNPAWFAFAEENGKGSSILEDWTLGRNLFDAIPDALEGFYRTLFESAWDENISPYSTRHAEYECHSPHLYRRFSMHLYPLNRAGMLIAHSLLVEEPFDRSSAQTPQTMDDYLNEDGMFVQCSNCRRLKHAVLEERWDWIPEFIQDPRKKTTHSICSLCLQHYYLSRK